MYKIFTDGSSRGNPGPGGFGVIVFDGENVKESGGREEHTTNNRMELTAAIEALKSVPEDSEAEVYADSEYVINGITLWIKNWQRNNWRTKDRRDVLNRDLWEKLWEESTKRNVIWKKVLGHSGHGLNERCDAIATSFADGKTVVLYHGPEARYEFK